MKKKLVKLIALSIIGFMPLSIHAQFGDVTKMLNGGITDANKLTEAYLNPIGKGLAVNLSNGWYNTAKPHSFPNPTKLSFFLGFDITLTTSLLVVPEVDKTFNINNLSLQSLHPTTTGSTISQNISGSKTDGPELGLGTKLPNGEYMSKFKLPQGLGLSYVPSVMIQGGIGLPFSSELDFRYVPTMKIPFIDGKIGLWGLGLKHSIKQWIPVISLIPFFDISAQAGYTSFKSSVSGTLLAYDPTMYNTTGLPATYKDQFNDQGIELTARSFTGNLVVSTDIPVFNVYAGVGFYTASSTLSMNGHYPIPDLSAPPTVAEIAAGQTKPKPKSISNPIKIDFSGNGGMRANIGARLKLLILAINADITYAGGSTIYTAGIGINFH